MDQQKKLSETLRQLRIIVVKFADDCVRAFPEIARAHEHVFRYYLKFGSVGDQEVFAVYDYMCRKYPERATLIWMRDAQLFDNEFIAHHGLADCELLPRLDFRHLYFATQSDDAREQLWLYIQGMLMLTLNECNRHLAEMQEHSRKSLEDFFELGGDGESPASGSGSTASMASLFHMMESEDFQIEEIVNRLNAHFATASAATNTGESASATGTAAGGEDDDNGGMMDTDDGDDNSGGAGNAFPAFDSEHIKKFMGTLADTKFGRLAQEVVAEFMERHPELTERFRELVEQQAGENGGGGGRLSTMAVLRFLLRNKCLSMKELFTMVRERLRQKLQAGEFTMDELRKEFPKFMQSLSKMSAGDVREMAKAAGAKGTVDTERLRRELSKEQSKDRMRQKLFEKKRREMDAAIKMSTGMLGGFDAADAYDHLRECNLSEARAASGNNNSGLSNEEQQRQWKQTQEEVLALFSDNAGIAGSGGAPSSASTAAYSRARKQGKR